MTKEFFRLGEKIGSSSYFLALDHLGSAREVTDASAGVQAQYSYSPFGEQTKIAETRQDADFGFAHMYVHPRSGLNLTMFRAYNPAQGRWLSRDPMGEQMGTNLYGYVGNNPIGLFDPIGLASLDSLNASVEQAIATNNGAYIRATLRLARPGAQELGVRLNSEIDRRALEAIVRLRAGAGGVTACGAGIVGSNPAQVLGKVEAYLLSDPSKAGFFLKNLGIGPQNASYLANQIVFDANSAFPTAMTQFGQKFSQVQSITGLNGNTISVNFVWQQDFGTNTVRLISATFK